jgi:CheY-like chemotaxis protein
MSDSRYILIVDDDQDMSEVVRAVLEAEGYPCRCAANGQQALAEVAAAMPGLILLDMLMPVMNGWEAAHELRQSYGRGLPIVIMTAAEHAEARREGVAADDVLAKPFELRDLLRVVAKYVPSPRV